MEGKIIIEAKETESGTAMRCQCAMSGVGVVDKALLVKHLYDMLEVQPLEQVLIQALLDSGVLDNTEEKSVRKSDDDTSLDDFIAELRKGDGAGSAKTARDLFERIMKGGH